MNKLKLRSFWGSLLLALISTALISNPVSATNWYAGNFETNGNYGSGAYIYTPSSAPYLAPLQYSAEFSFVSTASYPYWAQTGWLYDYGTVVAFPYVEYSTSAFGYTRSTYGTQSWGAVQTYVVSYTNGGWGTYIGGQQKVWITATGTGLPTPPCATEALSEIHISSSNVLDTWFSSVCYFDSNGYPNYYDQANWRADSPYQVARYSDWYYHTYGP